MSVSGPFATAIAGPVAGPLTAPGIGGGAASLTAQVQGLFAKYSGVGGIWKWDDMTTLFQAAGLTTPVTASGQSVWSVADISGQGNHLTTGNASTRPQFNGNGVTPDGVDDYFVTAANLDLTVCDKVVVAMGYTKIDDTARLQVDGGANNAGGLYLLTGLDDGLYQSSLSRGDAAGDPTQTGGFASSRANAYGAHITRHSIPGDLSEVWWNGAKGTDGVGDKGAGSFGSYPLYLLSYAGSFFHSNTPAHRGIVLGVPVADVQVSDPDIEIIRQWLMEGS